ncbi:hypothetical protein ACQR16_10245 [Bradyrhizobium oligotrophicum]|uniref:hypothetical protein n=1 Tax=Bradyrhizobium oligotrophicum TaxID=44255 RepID=UPI003EBF8379
MRRNADFERPFNAMTVVQMPPQKYSSFVLSEFIVCCAHTASGRGRIAVVTAREAGSDGRDGSQHVLQRRADERFVADGEVVWS